MKRRMNIDEFEKSLNRRDISTSISTIGNEISRYHGQDIHCLGTLQFTLSMVKDWINVGFTGSAKTFGEFSSKDPISYGNMINGLYHGFERGIYKI